MLITNSPQTTDKKVLSPYSKRGVDIVKGYIPCINGLNLAASLPIFNTALTPSKKQMLSNLLTIAVTSLSHILHISNANHDD